MIPMIPIARIASEFGEIAIFRNEATGVVRYDQGQIHQSEADANGVSLVAYIHGIFDLLLQAGCRNVLMIGCGGGTLATMLHRTGVTVTVADIDSWSFRLARQYFQLPAEVACHAVDGAAFLRAGAQRYDGIVLDAYAANRLPSQFTASEFLATVHDRLSASSGIFIANIHLLDDGDPAAARYAERMSGAWPEVLLLDTPGGKNRNALLMAGRVAGLMRPILRVPPAIGAAEIAQEMDRLALLRQIPSR
jgi:spermidine synthase